MWIWTAIKLKYQKNLVFVKKHVIQPGILRGWWKKNTYILYSNTNKITDYSL